MAWIESHQNLERHPKRAALSAIMGWSKPETIGRLHMLWWWTLDFAEDGDLRKYNDAQIAEAMCVDISKGAELCEALVQARWLERKPYFRVRNWWSYVGRFLKTKYKDNPDRWKIVFDSYSECVTDTVTPPVTDTVTPPVTDTATSPATRLTLPTLTNLTNQPTTKLPASPTDPVPNGDKATKATKLNASQKWVAKRLQDALGLEWFNDAGKWINRVKNEFRKAERVIAEVESAIKESRIKTTPARYAEQIWKEFK